MSTISIQPTYPIFTDIDGQPLENGYVWIGTLNLDPQTNPIVVYWDAALTIPAAQPIRTIGGYLSNNGSPANIYAAQEYSIRVMNKNGSVIYSAADGSINNVFFSAIGESLSTAATAAAARSVIGAAASGANNDITSLAGLTTALSIAQGGTGQTSASNAINALLPSQSGNTGLVLTTNGTTASWGSPLTVGASTTLSGTATDITGIRSGARRITVNFAIASTNGTSAIALQLGDSGGIEATGYVSGCASIDGTNATSVTTVTSAFALLTASVAAAQYSGTVVLTRVDAATNAWVAHGSLSADNGLGHFPNGRKLLSAELDRLRITTLTGVNTFDGGSVTITVE